VQITTRIVAYVVAWTLVVLLTADLLQLRRDIDIGERDLVRECALVGALMGDDVAAAFARGGLEAARARAAALTAHEDQISAHVVTIVPDDPNERSHLLDIAAWRTVDPAALHHVDAAGEQLRALVPLQGNERLALELRASLAPLHDIHERALLDFLLLAGVVAIAGGFFAAVSGRSLVGRRVDALIAVTRAAARSEPAPAVPRGRGDELDDLGVALAAMHRELGEARAAQERHAQERASLRDRLQHQGRLATAGLMVGRVAHEVGTPLGVVLGRLRRLQRVAEGNAAAQREAAAALEQVERIEGTLSNMLGYVRRERATETSADAREAVLQAVDLVANLGRERGVRVRPVVGEAPVWVRGDRLGLEQIVVNLLVNAVRVSPQAGTVEAHVRADREVGLCRIEVLDRGPGVPEAQREQIFEAFFTTGGIGLGLAIVHSLVEDRGGRVGVDDREGGGARFHVELPMRSEEIA
jgi:signal transduction histidine kinase